jgi:hypothetical protein
MEFFLYGVASAIIGIAIFFLGYMKGYVSGFDDMFELHAKLKNLAEEIEGEDE